MRLQPTSANHVFEDGALRRMLHWCIAAVTVVLASERAVYGSPTEFPSERECSGFLCGAEVLVPKLGSIAKRGVGLNTRVGAAKFVGALALRMGTDIRPSSGALIKVPAFSPSPFCRGVTCTLPQGAYPACFSANLPCPIDHCPDFITRRTLLLWPRSPFVFGELLL